MFKISVWCDHEDQLNYDKKAHRVYIEADVFKVDTRKDSEAQYVVEQVTGSSWPNCRTTAEANRENPIYFLNYRIGSLILFSELQN
jgi:hypothetical protein